MPMNELWWLYRHPRRILAVWWRGLVAKLHCDVALWFDVRAISPLAVLTGLNCVAGLMLLQERGAGPFLRLTNLRMCIAAGAASLLIISSRWLLLRIERQPPAFWIRALLSAGSILPPITLLSISFSQNSLWASAVVLVLGVASANANPLWRFCFETDQELRDAIDDRIDSRRMGQSPDRSIRTPIPDPTAARFVELPTVLPAPKTADISQPVVEIAQLPVRSPAGDWQERMVNESGSLAVRGKLTATFSASQSQTTIHVPFVPALAELPEFSCRVVNAPGVRARTPAVFRYGARIELKRTSDADSALEVAVEYCALAALAGKRAA
jgi:hypothetical protein